MRPEVECSALVIQPTKPVAMQDASGATAVFCHHMEHQTEGPTNLRPSFIYAYSTNLVSGKEKKSK